VRVISLTCSNTEIVSELGMARHLVAVDDHSDWPESVVDGLTRVGPDLQIDADAVAALEPDLVLASLTVPGHERVVEAIERRGLPFIAPSPESLDDVFDDITLIGELLGAEAAASTLLSRMKSAFAGTDSPGRDRPNILIQWWPKPVIAPGRRSWVRDPERRRREEPTAHR
jgi:iron complex transport system substrate-binding protein